MVGSKKVLLCFFRFVFPSASYIFLQYLYDVWGAAANLASRMESTGVDRRIQVSENTYKRTLHIKDFRFTPRGSVFCKGIGEVTTYFVEDANKKSMASPEDLSDVK